ncbi:MAG: biopolymer transporter ExbD [Pontiellaceae bacterium]|nr:biopolymer transporter ExbD [Pontiellaceae bacterium]MBN2784780.1 biopolymer transporter ExbD [Pontiellaceae bacterium]
MKLSCGYETKKARVEMLPLIDVVFLLLVFFIYAMLSMVVHHGLKVELPAAGTAGLDQAEHITITIDAGNRIYLDETEVVFEELPNLIRALRGDSARPVFINGDQTADLGLAIRLLDQLKKEGIEEVSFSCRTSAP